MHGVAQVRDFWRKSALLNPLNYAQDRGEGGGGVVEIVEKRRNQTVDHFSVIFKALKIMKKTLDGA